MEKYKRRTQQNLGFMRSRLSNPTIIDPEKRTHKQVGKDKVHVSSELS